MSIYDQPPLSIFQQALMSQLGGAPAPQVSYNYMPEPAAPTYYGPTHKALSEAFKTSLTNQMAVPGLLSQMMNDPALAARLGGFALQSYTPNIPKTGISWAPPAAPPGMPGLGSAANGWLQTRGVYPGQNTVDFGSAGGATGDSSGSATGEAGSVGAGVGTAAGDAGATASGVGGDGNDGSSGVAW